MHFEWRESNQQPYLYVEAEDPFTLGLGVGKGLHKQIAFLQETVASKLLARDEIRTMIMGLVKQYSQHIPDIYMEEIKGMHAGFEEESGESIAFEDLLLQSVFINVIYKAMSVMPQMLSMMGCTNFAAINPDGSVTHGQNYDADGRMTAGNAFVHHKLKDQPEMFLFRTGADLGTATGKNDSGVCMTVSVIQSSLEAEIMTPRGVLIREAMQQDTALKTMHAMTDEKGRSPFSYNLVISDNRSVVASQATPFEQRIVQVKKQIVQSNQYDYIDWQKHLLKPSYSKKRQLFAEQLLDNIYARHGGVNNEDLLEILRDRPVICRTAENDGLGSTILFLTRESFGMRTAEGPVGRIPF